MFCKLHGALFHADTVQTVGHFPIDLSATEVDFITGAGHKIHGPKGIGALYIKEGISITPLIHGGGQEKGLRAGTYNTPLIVGFGEACRLAQSEFEFRLVKLKRKRQEIIDYYEGNGIAVINFKEVLTAPHILSVTLQNQDAEDYLLLNAREFVASTGSACSSNIIQISHVIEATQLSENYRILRISFAFNE
jgi:cysteine desulfurase